MSKKVWSLRKRAATRIKAVVATVIVLLVALVALAAWGIWQARPQPDRLAEATATAEPTAETATVTVDGEGVATDVTVTVVDPDDPDTSSQVTESNVELPATREVLVEPGQQVQVAASNGTSDAEITTEIQLGDQTSTDTDTGFGGVASTEASNE